MPYFKVTDWWPPLLLGCYPPSLHFETNPWYCIFHPKYFGTFLCKIGTVVFFLNKDNAPIIPKQVSPDVIRISVVPMSLVFFFGCLFEMGINQVQIQLLVVMSLKNFCTFSIHLSLSFFPELGFSDPNDFSDLRKKFNTVLCRVCVLLGTKPRASHMLSRTLSQSHTPSPAVEFFLGGVQASIYSFKVLGEFDPQSGLESNGEAL
jgi:hypothetical protein